MSKPHQLENGRVIVMRKENFVEWCAWREWLHMWTGRTVFLEKQVVWSDWPPETQPMVDKVIQTIRDARVRADFGLPCAANPQPWQRWSLNQRLDCERMHREDFYWNPPLPIPMARLHTARGPDSDPASKNWFDLKVESLPPALPKEKLHEYRRRNNMKSPEYRKVKWEETAAALPEENLTTERKAQLAKLRELAGVKA